TATPARHREPPRRPSGRRGVTARRRSVLPGGIAGGEGLVDHLVDELVVVLVSGLLGRLLVSAVSVLRMGHASTSYRRGREHGTIQRNPLPHTRNRAG